MMSEVALDRQQERGEEQDFSYREEQAFKKLEPLFLETRVEKIPDGNWKKIMNLIVWGNEKGLSKYDKQ